MITEENIYLDYAAATPMDPEVLESMLPYYSENFYNPSAPYALARKTKTDIESARARIAHCMGAQPGNLVITAGATEANNLAFAAIDGSVVTIETEHESTLACAKSRTHQIVGVSAKGIVNPDDVEAAISTETELVSIALANGELGCIQPIREIAERIRKVRQNRLDSGDFTPLWLHTDASQAATTLSVNVSSLGADLITLSAAKMYGPKQVGLLWARDEIALRPLVLGGGQEAGLRSGTENVAGIIGFARAFELATQRRKEEARRLSKLRNQMQRALMQAFKWAIVSGPDKDSMRLPGLLHISFPGLEARRLVILLDQQGVSVGTGSACAASKMKTSHVLNAIGLPEETANGSLRITLGHRSNEEQVNRACSILIDVVETECKRTGIHQEGPADE